jgi:phage terminase small subunit
MATLTPKQQRFVEEYLVDLNATAAAKRAGYSQRTAEWQGPQLLGKTHVAQAIAAQREQLSQRTAVTQDRIAQELARLSFFDIRKLVRNDGTPLGLHELDEDTARAIVGIDVVSVGNADVGVGQVLKFKLADKGANVERLAKLLGYFERDNKQKNPLGAFNAAQFFAQLVHRPEEA